MMDLEHSKKALLKLTELGFLIAMDDFGTGYSSLNYLQKLPFDVLKIDKSFLKEIMDKKETLIYKTVIELAHSMGLMVVAEGVETLEQVEFIKDCKCDIGQGYYYYKPQTPEEFEKILQNN
jgi:EAL domain-containing protein (putative c-di-GMP-specific phosphodiesterase class I)